MAGLTLALATLTACGGGSDKLSEDQREDVLLTVDNLGEGFETDEDPDDDDDDPFGCLGEADDLGADGSPSAELLDASIERLRAVMDDEDVPEPEPLLEDLANRPS